MIATYQPGIPTGTVALSQDYLNLQKNFGALNTIFGVDHLPFSNATAQQGYHTDIHLVPFSTTASNPPNNQPVVAPGTTTGYSQIFSSQINDLINTDEALYFLSGNGNLSQLTRNFLPSVTTSGVSPFNTNGATFLPGGLIVNYGNFGLGSGSSVVTFTQKFPTAIYAIVVGGTSAITFTQPLGPAPFMTVTFFGTAGVLNRGNYVAIGA